MWTRVEERIFKMNSSIRQELHQEHGQETVRSSSRRHFLSRVAMGSIPLSLAALAQKAAHAEPVKPNLGLQSFDLLPKPTHHEPQAKAMISMFMQGGPSQIDLMDPKPILNKMHLQK